jgi:phosphoribosyl 1,2-cyclic phosphodiesterase
MNTNSVIESPNETASSCSVRFRGVRGSIPSPGHKTARYGGNTSCVELRSGDQILILDAGSGLRELGSDLMEEFAPRPIHADLLISHTHWDHIQGLPFFAPIYSSRNRIRVLGANGQAQSLARALRNQMMTSHFPVGPEQMRGLVGIDQLDAAETQLGIFTVRTTSLNHPGGCSGFRIDTSGASIAYLPDHEPFHSSCLPNPPNEEAQRKRESLLQFMRGVDLLILDTQYTVEEYAIRIGWGHGCLPDSVRCAIDAGVSRLFLFHHDPAHDDHRIDQLVEAARGIAAGSSLLIDAAVEGEVFQLTRSLRAMAPLPPALFPLPGRVVA